MAKVTAITAALKFFHKLSVEDLSASFDLSELKKLRTLILRERKKPESVVTGKDIGKINKAIEDRPKFEKAREESVGTLEAESGDITDVIKKAGPKIEPTPTSTNVEVLKKPRRKIKRKKGGTYWGMRNFPKGGMVKRPQMMHGGSHKSKKHAYAAGGSVKEMKLFK